MTRVLQPITVIIGDFNGALGYLGGNRICSEPNQRGKRIDEFFNFFNLSAVNLGKSCACPLETFYADSGTSSSAIDPIVVPRALTQYINWTRVFDREAENLSDHIPIAISYKKSLLQHNNKSGSSLGYSRKHVSWHKFNAQQIHNLYTLPLEESLKHFDCELEPDKCFENLNEIIWDISETNLHVTSSNSKNTSHSKRHFQLPEDIQAIKNDLNTLHGQWKATGSNKQSHVFTDFKLKRNEYRSGLRQFILCKENNKNKEFM